MIYNGTYNIVNNILYTSKAEWKMPVSNSKGGMKKRKRNYLYRGDALLVSFIKGTHVYSFLYNADSSQSDSHVQLRNIDKMQKGE